MSRNQRRLMMDLARGGPFSAPAWQNPSFFEWAGTYPDHWSFRLPNPAIPLALTLEQAIRYPDNTTNSYKVNHALVGGKAQIFQGFSVPYPGQRCRVTAHVYYDTAYNGTPKLRIPATSPANPASAVSPVWAPVDTGLSFIPDSYVTVATPANFNYSTSEWLVVDVEGVLADNKQDRFVVARQNQWQLVIKKGKPELRVWVGTKQRFVKSTTKLSVGDTYRIRALRQNSTGTLLIYVYTRSVGTWALQAATTKNSTTGNLAPGSASVEVGRNPAGGGGHYGTLFKIGVFGGASVPAGWDPNDGSTFLDTIAALYDLYYKFDSLDSATVTNYGTAAGSDGTLGTSAPTYNHITTSGTAAIDEETSGLPGVWHRLQLEWVSSTPTPGSTVMLESSGTAGNVYWDAITVDLV